MSALVLVFASLAVLILIWLLVRNRSTILGFRAFSSTSPSRQEKPPTSILTEVECKARDAEDAKDRAFEIEEAKRAKETRRIEDKDLAAKSIANATDRGKAEEAKKAEATAREAERGKVAREYASYIGKTVPPDIQHAMRAFLAGDFTGADRSPFAYVGYHVGTVNGLAPSDRKRRMLVCLRMDIPTRLRGEYGSWGDPVSQERLYSMCRHLTMLASMRRGRSGFETAVAEWKSDTDWLRSEAKPIVERFARYRVAF